MKYQILFSRKIRKITPVCHLLNLPRVEKVNSTIVLTPVCHLLNLPRVEKVNSTIVYVIHYQTLPTFKNIHEQISVARLFQCRR